MQLMNSFYKYKNTHTYTWSAHNSKAIIDYYIIANNKLSDLLSDVSSQMM